LNKHVDDIEDRVLAADVRDALFRFVIGAEFALVPGTNRFAQRHNAGGWRVLCFVFVDGLDGRLFNVIRSRKIRFTRAEVGDVHALGLKLIRGGNYGCGWRAWYAGDEVR